MVAPPADLPLDTQLPNDFHRQNSCRVLCNMRFLILVSLAVAAVADYHDDTFHFSSLGGQSGLSGGASGAVRGGRLLRPAALPLTRKVTTVQSGPVLIAQPLRQVVAPAPALFRRQEIPVFAAPSIAQRVQQVQVQQIAQPAFVSEQATYGSEPKWHILAYTQEIDPSGPYKLSYSTENGIRAEEEGALVPSANGPVIAAKGAYAYTGPDGAAYSVSYVADENGFRAAGDHLPTPPPIPAEILKSLEENAASGEQYDDQGNLVQK